MCISSIHILIHASNLSWNQLHDKILWGGTIWTQVSSLAPVPPSSITVGISSWILSFINLLKKAEKTLLRFAYFGVIRILWTDVLKVPCRICLETHSCLQSVFLTGMHCVCLWDQTTDFLHHETFTKQKNLQRCFSCSRACTYRTCK